MSSIDQAIESAVMNLKAMQQGFSVASNNIANANDPNYTKRSLVLAPNYSAGQVNGVKVENIERFYDKFLDQSIRESASKYHKDETIRNYLEQISALLGKVGDESNPDVIITKVFDLMTKLTGDNPDNLAIKDEARNRLKHLAFTVSNLAKSTFEYQYEVDKGIENSVKHVNDLLDKLYQINIDINKAVNVTGEATNLMEQRDALLKDLANYVDCKVNHGPKGEIEVSLNDGTTILSNYKVQLGYVAQQGSDNFISKSYINPITVTTYSGAGDFLSSKDISTTDYEPTRITTILKGGKIKGLMEIRDKYLPKYQEMLNKLAEHITNEFNKIHNCGSGYPPLSVYKATRPVSGNDMRQWSGNAKFAVVDKNGVPIKRVDGSTVKPLDLDLSKLYSSTIDGRFDVRTFMNEFNTYFQSDATSPRASLGLVSSGAKTYDNEYLLRDVRLAATRDLSTTPKGVFKFDVELDSDAQFGANFQVLDVVVKDSLGVVVNGALTSSIPGSYKLEAGTRKRTGQEITVDFGVAAGNGPFTIELSARVAGDDGTIDSGTFSFVIDDNPVDPKVTNKRYLASSTSGGVIIDANNNQPFAQVRLVDENGNNVIGDNKPGKLVFETFNPDMRLIIQDDTSMDLGIPGTNNPATNRGFGHYFGINDLFVQSFDDDINTALAFKLRADIEQKSTHLSTGQLTREIPKIKKAQIDAQVAQGSIKFDTTGALPDNGDTLTVNGVTYTFWDTVAPVPTNPITIVAGDWSSTLNNILAELQAANATTNSAVEKAAYTLSVDTVNIAYKVAGVTGNSFSLSTNFANISASLNNKRAVRSDNVNLYGGTDTKEIKELVSHSYKLSIGANQVTNMLAKLSDKVFFFEGGELTVSVSTTLVGYVSAFVSTMTADESLAKITSDNLRTNYETYFNRFKQAGGVNADEQMIDILKFQHSYSASAKVISVSRQLMDTLLNSF
ncbi:MAG: flgK [Rickettsiaceae bacterium]|jgi:flagellar hook-associated protein 1 FlgK|nr:flgK [Rickettsiaceae bacterium]